MTSKFCSAADVHPHINNEDGFTGDDTLINAHILIATALIREYTRRDWTKAVYTDYFTTVDVNLHIRVGKAAAPFYLREKPLSTLVGEQPVVRYSSSGEWDDATDLTTNYYEVDHRKNAVIIYPEIMRSSVRSLRVTYTAGYAVDGTDPELLLVSPNLKHACAIQAADRVRHVLNETSGKKSKQDRKGLAEFSRNSSGLVGEALSLIKSEPRLFVGS
jgi:hypothetical protein